MNLQGIYCHGGIVGRASNLLNPNTSGTFDTEIGIGVSRCIAWNPSITTTLSAGDTPATHYSSGAVVGFSVFRNTLSGCVRRPDMQFNVYSESSYNTLQDQEDTSPSAPLARSSGNTYHCPYNGKAAAAGATLSSVAQSLGWSASVWDFSADEPRLKQ